MADLIITIDGPAASGKSTVAAMLAEKLGAGFLDTGAMYRAVTLAAMQADVDMNDENKLFDVLDKRQIKFAIEENKMTVSIDGVDVTDQLRRSDVTANARYIASSMKVRGRLVQMQRQLAAGKDKIVTEGRDQGTVAFPDANVKFYLTAAAAERAKRRAKEQGLTAPADIERIQKEIEARDESDQNRAVGPMKPAGDAVTVDTTDLTVEQVVSRLEFIVHSSLKKNG
jgi:cytidylate kinase